MEHVAPAVKGDPQTWAWKLASRSARPADWMAEALIARLGELDCVGGILILPCKYEPNQFVGQTAQSVAVSPPKMNVGYFGFSQRQTIILSLATKDQSGSQLSLCPTRSFFEQAVREAAANWYQTLEDGQQSGTYSLTRNVRTAKSVARTAREVIYERLQSCAYLSSSVLPDNKVGQVATFWWRSCPDSLMILLFYADPGGKTYRFDCQPIMNDKPPQPEWERRYRQLIIDVANLVNKLATTVLPAAVLGELIARVEPSVLTAPLQAKAKKQAAPRSRTKLATATSPPGRNGRVADLNQLSSPSTDRLDAFLRRAERQAGGRSAAETDQPQTPWCTEDQAAQLKNRSVFALIGDSCSSKDWLVVAHAIANRVNLFDVFNGLLAVERTNYDQTLVELFRPHLEDQPKQVDRLVRSLLTELNRWRLLTRDGTLSAAYLTAQNVLKDFRMADQDWSRRVERHKTQDKTPT